MRNPSPASIPYLEPEDSPFSLASGMKVYELTLAESLLRAAERVAQSLALAWQREETASLVCLPSFEPEWALWVVGESNGRPTPAVPWKRSLSTRMGAIESGDRL